MITALITPFIPASAVCTRPLTVSTLWSHIVTPSTAHASMKLSSTLAVPMAMNVQTLVPMMITTGRAKFSTMLLLGEADGSISVSSLPIMGMAPSRRTFPVSIVRSSAFRMGPKSGMIWSTISPTITTVRME